MENISEYETRQLKLMRETLNDFEKKQISLFSLVDRLDSLISTLESVNRNWREKFKIGDLEVINSIEIIKEFEKNNFIQPIEWGEKEKLINNSIFKIKEAIENELRRQVKIIGETNMKNLSFPDFEVEKMEFSLEKKTLKIFMKSALLKENKEKRLSNGILFFNNWESLEINKFNPVTGIWSSVEIGYPEYLKYLFELKFFNSSICLCGFSEENQLEWKIINTQMHAEFEPDAVWKED